MRASLARARRAKLDALHLTLTKQVAHSNAVVATASLSFIYDTNYNRLLTMIDGVGTNAYAYFGASNTVLGAGRLQSVDGPLANDTISYTYDELGRVKSRAIDGAAQQISYDELGRVTVLTNVLGSFTNTYVNATMRPSTNFYPNGQRTVFSYYGASNDFRLQQIQHSILSTQLSTFSYTYDADGQIATWTQQADSSTPKVQVFEYDPVDQLLAATVRSNTLVGAILKRYVYSYDKAANRTTEQIDLGLNTASYNNLNQLASTASGSGPVRFAGWLNETAIVTIAGSPATMGIQNTSFIGFAETILGTNTVAVRATDYSNNSRTNNYQVVVTNNGAARTLSYDLNGNLTNMVTSTSTNNYEWDAVNRLTKITQSPTVGAQLSSEFTYDGAGRRVRIVEKTNGVVQTDKRFLWCSSELCEERDSTGATVTKHFFAQGEQINGTNYFFSRDHLGSVRELTDSIGAIRARYEYAPYGRRTKVSGDVEADFGFTGHYYNSTTALHLPLYRAYDADVGRWTSRDPMEETEGPNLYAYVKNNPINAIDPDGGVIYEIKSDNFPGHTAIIGQNPYGGYYYTGFAAKGGGWKLSHPGEIKLVDKSFLTPSELPPGSHIIQIIYTTPDVDKIIYDMIVSDYEKMPHPKYTVFWNNCWAYSNKIIYKAQSLTLPLVSNVNHNAPPVFPINQ